MAHLTYIVDLFAILLFVAVIRAFRDHRRRGGLPYPPGPRPLPIIGNFLDIPKQSSWLAYTRFSKIYGDIISFHVFGQTIIVLNTAKAAKDLLEKRGDIYVDRPEIPFSEMMGWQWVLPTARGDENWRLGRRVLDRGLRPAAAASFRPMLQARVRVLLSRILEKPHEWESHIEMFQGGLILAMTYGYEARDSNDRMLDASTRMIRFGSAKILPGALLVNEIPFLRHIPEWLPWLSYKPLARFGHELGNEVLYTPIQFVKESIRNGTALPSLALENLQEVENRSLRGPDRDKAEETIAGALGSIYSAGAETTIGAIMTFFVAMLLYPDVLKRAQNELDFVIGRDRLPTFEDRPRLPFIDAIYKEVMRWRPVTPVALPHAPKRDDVYAGFFIPKDAVVIGNTWAILHDAAFYPEPDVFKPERFLNSDGSPRDDPILPLAFGFGKRVCPGRHVADATLFILIASFASVFNIEREGGGGNLSDYPYKGALVSSPTSFPCSFIPRDQKARELILADTMAR